MFQIIATVVVVIALAVILFALLILIGFCYLFIKVLKQAAGIIDYDDALSNQVVSKPSPKGDQYTPETPEGEVPLDQFTPNPKKPLKLIYTEGEDSHGIEEVEEEDTA